MKKCLMVLTAVMLVALFVPTASAAYIICGGVGSPSGSTVFGAGSTLTGNATLLAGTATLTCTGITVPVNTTLTGIDLYLKDDAQAPSGLGSGVNFTWLATSGVTFVPATEMVGIASSDGINFDECTGISGPYVGNCPAILHFAENVAAGSSFNNVVITVSAAAVSGGVSSVGSDSANLYIQFDESSGTPEPATLVLIGGGLLGLGVFARKRFSRP